MADITYQEYVPLPPLAPYVLCYWEFVLDAAHEGTYLHHVMPDGCVTLLYARFPTGGDMLRLSGPRLGEIRVPLQPGTICWGVRFWPGATDALLHLTGDTLRDQSADFADLFPALATTLATRLSACTTDEEAITVYDQVLTAQLDQTKPLDALVCKGVAAIMASQGQTPIKTLVDDFGISERQFQRRFRQAVGLTPKQFARIRRFRSSVSNVLLKQPEAWAQVAAEYGYADQAHLSREYRQLVGLTPTTFHERVRVIKHVDVTP